MAGTGFKLWPRGEECGICGIFGHKEAANYVYLGLYALQHRGQESSGMAVYGGDPPRLRGHRAMELVADCFDEARIRSLSGSHAIGHVRYSTNGSNLLANAQPLICHTAQGSIAAAHNGNLVNSRALRRDLEGNGSIFQGTSDTEVILHLIARSRADGLRQAIIEALTKVQGAYSLLFLSRDRMIAVRDPHGFRPLCLGKFEGSLVLASETCALDLIGAQYVRDIEPGELVEITEMGLQSYRPWPTQPHHHCIFEHIYFSRPDSFVFGEEVHTVRKRIGANLAAEDNVEADIVVPVPDSSICAGLGYAQASGLPYEIGMIRNHYVGRTFIEPNQHIRDFGAKIKYNPVRGAIAGKRLIVVDDSIVRGTTARKIIDMLRRGGAKEVHLRSSCPPIIAPCYYGVDTPSKAELIAANYSVEEICKRIGADSVAYPSLKGLLSCVERPEEYCIACFTGTYPTCVPSPEDEELREQERLQPSLFSHYEA